MSVAEILPSDGGSQELRPVGLHAVSAPENGADFFIAAQEEIEENEWAFSSDFPRLSSGLVDVDVYLDYLPDHPDTIPPIVLQSDKKGLRHQHVYYWRSFFRQKQTPKHLRDLTLLNFWRAPYNQILMRLEEEAKIHERYTRLVSPPPIRTMENSLVDFGQLDRLGAAAVGRRVTMVPEAFDYVSKELRPHIMTKQYSPLEIAQLFDDEIENAIASLQRPLVTPQRVVTGAISRMARLTNNERLIAEANRRTDADPTFLPVRIRDPRASFIMSRAVLDKRKLVEVITKTPMEETERAA